MRRLLIAVVLMMVVLAVVAAPAFAYLDSQAGTPIGAPVGAPHTIADAHHHSSADVVATSGKTAQIVKFHAHGRHIGMVPASTGGNALSSALLALLVIGLSAAAFAEGRQAPARSARPVRLPAFRPGAHQERKAA
jgi:hypothetical protein